MTGKTLSTDSRYQSTFMPIFEKAETRIKLLIVTALLLMWSETYLRARIIKEINEVEKRIGKGKEDYIRGLRFSANRFILLFYKPQVKTFQTQKKELAEFGIKVKTPNELINLSKKKLPHSYSEADKMWKEAKGAVRVQDYSKKLKQQMAQLAQTPAVTHEKGKHSISLWQKAELDVRYEHQMKMLEDAKKEGDLYWISSHPNASSRCAPYQGKLVSLTEHANYPNFRVRKEGRFWVYSLPDIMVKKDKYGYQNNIICGFNCRHHLIKFDGQLPPKHYDAEDVKKQREIEQNIRAMERAIRNKKQNLKMLLMKNNGKKDISKLKKEIDNMITKYKSYCERNGYAWEQYRIEV